MAAAKALPEGVLVRQLAEPETAVANGMKKIKEYPDGKNEISYAYAITRKEWSMLER